MSGGLSSQALAQPLAGRRVVVTRPAAQAEGVSRALAELGAEVLRFPLLSIAPLEDPAPLKALAARLADFALAFFVSPNAVNFSLDVLQAVAPWPAGLMVATVGQGSEAALAARGFREVIAPVSGFDSEAVLALPAFQAAAVAGRRVLILRGDGGRDLLGDTLSARGAIVEYGCCYHRGGPPGDPAELVAQPLDALSFTSSEGLAYLLGLAGMDALKDVAAFVPHPRIAAAARAGGFAEVILTGAGDAGLVAGLLAHFGALRPAH